MLTKTSIQFKGELYYLTLFFLLVFFCLPQIPSSAKQSSGIDQDNNSLKKKVTNEMNEQFNMPGQNNIHDRSKTKLNELANITEQTHPAEKFSAGMSPQPKTIPEDSILFGDEATTDKMFGLRGGYIHPYFSLQGIWTDNLFNINFDERDSFVTQGATGIWYSLPRLENIPLNFSTNNSAMGGKRLSFYTESDSFERSILYLLGGIKYTSYSEYSDLNNSSWKIEGMYQQNLPAGISINIIDRFSREQDSFDIGSFQPKDFISKGNDIFISSTPSLIRNYNSNLANLNLLVDMTGKISSELHYSNFYLDYEDDENNWLDRTDNRFAASLNYKYSPKTNFFLAYNHVIINYDTENNFDSDSSFYFAGIKWKGSDKTSLYLKGGYQDKKFDTEISKKLSTFTTELRLNYAITDKTKISFNVYKALEESNSRANDSMDTTISQFNYQQWFNYRLLGRIDFTYEKNDYEGFTSTGINDNIDAREDSRFRVRLAIEYTFRDWMMCDLAYIFEHRNSNQNMYDFTAQTISLSLNIEF